MRGEHGWAAAGVRLGVCVRWSGVVKGSSEWERSCECDQIARECANIPHEVLLVLVLVDMRETGMEGEGRT